MQLFVAQNALLCKRQGETLRIEPWGRDALRVRATMEPEIREKSWALTEPSDSVAEIQISEEPHWVGDGTWDTRPTATICNGRIKAAVNFAGVISFFRDDVLFLREYYRF